MTPYILFATLLMAASICSVRLNERSQKLLYITLCVLLALFIIVRDFTINIDYDVYKMLYRRSPSWDLLVNNLDKYRDTIKTEFSYSALCSYLKSTGLERKTQFGILFGLYALLGVWAKTRGTYLLSDLKFQALFLYFCNLYLLQEMTQMRAGVAIGFILISIYYIQQGKWWQGIALILVASFFHTSALIALVLLLFKSLHADARVWIATFIVCIVIHLQVDILKLIDFIPFEYYQFKLKAYIDLQAEENFEINYFNVVFLLQIAVILLGFAFRERLEADFKYINIMLNMCSLGACSYVFFGQIPGFAFRINEVLACPLFIMIPCLARLCKPKALAELVVYGVGWGMLLINIFHSELVLEYKTLWN